MQLDPNSSTEPSSPSWAARPETTRSKPPPAPGQCGVTAGPFVGDAAASSRRSAATRPVPLQLAHRSFASLSDDPYPWHYGLPLADNSGVRPLRIHGHAG